MAKISQDPRRIMIMLFVLGILAWWLFAQVLFPHPAYIDMDPEMPYLMSSLAPFNGQGYTFIDHPGTPVEIIGTTVLAATYPFTQTVHPSFVMAHIVNPQVFLFSVRTLIVFASILTMVLLAMRGVPTKHWTDEIASVALAVFFFAIYPRAFDSIVHWSHNSFSFPIGGLLGLGLISLMNGALRDTGKNRSVLGFLLGLLIAVQVYFVTWLLGAVVALGAVYFLSGEGGKIALRSTGQVVLATIAGFLVATLPILDKYGEFARWIITVTTHQGRHGSGPQGFLSWDSAAANLAALVKDAPLLFASIMLTVLLLAWAAWVQRTSLRSNARAWACVSGFLVQLLIMLVLVVKHPGIIYLQAVAVCLVLLLLAAFPLVRGERAKARTAFRLFKFGLSMMVFGLFAVNLTKAMLVHTAEFRHVQEAVDEIQGFVDDYEQSHADGGREITKLWVYGMPSECMALWYGNQYTDGAFTSEIASLCPHDLFYDLWEQRVTLPDGRMAPLGDVSWDILIATEAALLDFPQLREAGQLIYADVSLGTFGRIVFLVNP